MICADVGRTHDPNRGHTSRGRNILASVAVITICGSLSGVANAQVAKIVGIGAATCREFLSEIVGRPDVEKNFFAWVQGYMSGLLMRAPPGKDEGLDLAPSRFPLLTQADFLRSYCSGHQGEDFVDAVNTLYRTLRAPPG